MNDPTLNTLLEFVIRADDGEVESVNIVRSSGQLRFDAQAVAIAHSIGPHPEAPSELVSPDGRDGSLSIRQVQSPGELAGEFGDRRYARQ